MKPRAKGRKVKQPGKGAKKQSAARGRPYPRVTLEKALRIPLALNAKNGGNSWPPADVAVAVGFSPKNSDFF